MLYFNRKYSRVGHLFQDRFKSESIDTDAYLLMALRYIHRNPVKAGLCARAEEYRRSSMNEYLSPTPQALTDTELIPDMMTREQPQEYTGEEDDAKFIDLDDGNRPLSDEEAKERMLRVCICASAAEFQRFSKAERDAYFRDLRSEGLYITQIGRITGFSRQLIYRALEE